MFSSSDQRRYLIPFRSLRLPQIFTETLIIGGGVAGMRAAIEAAKFGDVIIVLKQPLIQSASGWAQGGIAAVHAPGDTVDEHVRDTLEAGAGLCDEPAVRAMIESSDRCIEELLRWGMQFDRAADGTLNYGREGGHGRSRILHAGGAATGRELVRTLVTQIRGNERIRVFDECFALDLLSASSPDEAQSEPVRGAITHHPRYGLQIIWSRATILATGGAGQVYRETTNPRAATGDGLAMAYRAGAELVDLEFMQFHPTTLYVAGAGRALITEAVRGEGAYLIDRAGHRFMPEYHEMAELAPRDIVSRAIIEQIGRTRETSVYLDARHLDRDAFAKRFPDLVRLLAGFDLDPGEDLIPVSPSAHYTIGGVRTDLDGRTNLPGLYACGEAAGNGVHGANRLASNSLLEGLFFGARTARAIAEDRATDAGSMTINCEIRTDEHGELDLVDVRSSLRSAMWRNVGITRTEAKLTDVIEMFEFWSRYTMQNVFDDPMGWETQNLLTVGGLMSRAALARTESRGVQARLDYPATDPAWRHRLVWRMGEAAPRSTGQLVAEVSA